MVWGIGSTELLVHLFCCLEMQQMSYLSIMSCAATRSAQEPFPIFYKLSPPLCTSPEGKESAAAGEPLLCIHSSDERTKTLQRAEGVSVPKGGTVISGRKSMTQRGLEEASYIQTTKRISLRLKVIV